MHTDIKVGLSCNNACIHCIMSPVLEAMSTQGQPLDDSCSEVERKIGDAALRGYDRIVLTGGEVTLRSDFVHLVKYAVDQGLNVTIQTNGRRLSNPAVLLSLAAMDRHKVGFVIAYHSANPVVHDSVTRRQGSHAQTTKAIQALRELGFLLCGKVVLSLANYGELSATLMSLHYLGIQEVIVAFPHAEGFTDERFAEVVPTYTQLSEILREAFSAAKSAGMHVVFETFPFCVMNEENWPNNQDLFHISQESEPLSTVILMPGQQQAIDWRTTRKQIKSKPLQCSCCLFDNLCEGPWSEYVEHFGFAEFVPVDDCSRVDRFIARL